MPEKLKKVQLAPNELVPFSSPFIRYPVLASIKFDGWRLLVMEGVAYAGRSMKVMANKNLPDHLKELLHLSKVRRLVFDCELYGDRYNFNQLQSIFAGHNAFIPKDIKAYVFDMMGLDEWQSGNFAPFGERVRNYTMLLAGQQLANTMLVTQETHKTKDTLEQHYQWSLDQGYEGLIIRDPKCGYKHGRGTLREGIMFKFKPFDLADGQIIELVQGKTMKEGIEREKDNFGHDKPVHKKDDKELRDTAGCIRIKMEDGNECKIGFGKRSADEVKKLWDKRSELVGKWVKFEYCPVGVKEKPRFGRLVDFRDAKE